MMTLSQSDGDGGCVCCEAGCSAADTLHVTQTGISPCASCIYGQYKVIALTVFENFDVTGGAGTWTNTSSVGSITLETYTTLCAVSLGDTISDTLSATITCVDGFYSGSISAFVGTDHEVLIFFSNEGVRINNPMANADTCDTEAEAGVEGVITVSIP